MQRFMKHSLNNKDTAVYHVIVQAIALAENGLVWALAVWLVLSDSEWGTPRVEALLAKHISPIRPGRSRPRKLKTKQPFGFLYRVA